MQLVPTAERSADECGSAEVEYADFLGAIIKERRLSYRDIEAASGRRLTKSRLGRIFNEDRSKRSPIKLQEVYVLLSVLQVEYYQAALSIELIRQYPQAEHDTYTNIAMMVSNALRGLPEKIFDLLAMIDGLEASDIYPTHGRHIQQVVLERLELDYRGYAQRKDERIGLSAVSNF
ncbi:hypothetical protein [Asticcacaulis sp.]|uniref:hypothetical protein n=1 Tax=Asticcacaulis sp. TaxID=1872648 RepID=UPI002635A5C4|nr:hypothetical protein [Asticcacaulis sp.]